ncbi:MAG: 3-isopropylmalate/(R)-2-methylmalate dehydratase large subunit, partial [Myxococcota bacterium]
MTGPSTTAKRTLFDKVWDAHVVAQEPENPAILYVDLHLIHEVTSAPAFQQLRDRDIPLRRPDRTFATMDHITPTTDPAKIFEVIDDVAKNTLRQLKANCQQYGVRLVEIGDKRSGIVHIIGPELGLSQPGMTIVCGDSHTSTHGAMGALAFGIGTSEVGHVLATQTLLQRRPKSMEVRIEGVVGPGVTAKDIILALIAKIGIGGATGHVIEYRGEAIEALDMEGRMTVCNMSIEAGARAGMIAPDDTTIAYLAGRPYVPTGEAWDATVARWRTLQTDDGATFDQTITLDAAAIEPMITYGTNPAMGTAVTAAVPSPADVDDPSQRRALTKALDYMGVEAGQPLLGKPVDVVFIGSCTNARLSDLRAAASVMDGRKVADGVRMLVVPGSQWVKRDAEEEGLDAIFKASGAEW